MKFNILFFLLIISIPCIGQDTIPKKNEPIYQALNQSDFEKSLVEIENGIIKNNNYEDIYEYGRLALTYGRRFGDYDFALNSFNRILNSHKLPADISAQLEVSKLWVSLLQDKFDNLVSVSDSLLNITSSNELQGWFHYFKGQGLNESGDYESAASSYLESFKRFDAEKHLEGIAYAKTGLGDIQRNLGYIEKSKEYYKEAVDAAKKSKVTEAEINALSLSGISYVISRDYQTALSLFNEALSLAKRENDIYNMARNLNNLGNVYAQAGNHSQAIKTNQESLDLCLKTNMEYGAIANYLNLARNYTAIKDYNQALLYLRKGEVFIENKNFPAEQAEISNVYSIIYEGLNNYKEALRYYKQFYEQRRSLINNQTQRAVKELQIKYESELKDQEIEKANFELSLKESQNRNLWLGLGIAFLGIFFIIVFHFYRNKQLRELYESEINNLNVYKFIRKAADPGDPLRSIFDKILILLDEEMIYRKTTLSITELAEMIGSNEKYVSSAISKFSGQNYSNFINYYRINAAKQLILEDPNIQINDIMENCGFNSRTPFYNAFVKFTKMSPRQFKDMSSGN